MRSSRARVLDDLQGARDEATALIDRSLLPPDMKRDNEALLRERSAALAEHP